MTSSTDASGIDATGAPAVDRGPVLEFDKVTLGYGDFTVLQGLSLQINAVKSWL